MKKHHRHDRIAAATLLICVAVGTADPPAHFVAGTPIPIGRLDSGTLDLSQPRLFLTAEELDRARQRIESHPAFRAILDRFIEEAGQHLRLTIEPIDENWWQTVRHKSWAEIYPDVFTHTMRIPKRYAAPAAHLAYAALLTGEDKYAERAIELAMHLAPYSFAAEHYDVGMNYAIWCWDVLRVYDLLGHRLSAEQREVLDAFMTRLGKAVAKNDALWIANNVGGGVNNHLAWHKLMLGLLGLFYDRADLVEDAMYGPRGMVSLLADGLVDDGLWCESSLNYQFAAIGPMAMLAGPQRRVGYRPGIHEIVAANGRTLEQSFSAMLDVLGPDCLIPPIGDAYGARTRLHANHSYVLAWDVWRNSHFAWLVKQNPSPSAGLLFGEALPDDVPAPPIASVLLPEHGYAFLRSHQNDHYWHNPEARCAFLTYDRSGVHCNADKLGIMLFGRNRMLVSDVEARATKSPHAFSSDVQRDLNRGGLSQNTVMIDGADQQATAELLELVEYRDVPEDRRVTAADRKGLLYPGVRQMRTLSMTPTYVLDVFQVDCGKDVRQIDWIVHIMDATASLGERGRALLADAEPFSFPETGAYPYLRNAKVVNVPGNDEGGSFGLDWQSGEDRLRLEMLGGGLDRLIACDYPSTDNPADPGIPMLIARAHAPQALFVAVWIVGETSDAVRIEQLPDHGGKLVFEVSVGGATRRHTIPRLAFMK